MYYIRTRKGRIVKFFHRKPYKNSRKIGIQKTILETFAIKSLPMMEWNEKICNRDVNITNNVKIKIKKQNPMPEKVKEIIEALLEKNRIFRIAAAIMY